MRQQPPLAPPAAPAPVPAAVSVRAGPATSVREVPPPTFRDPERRQKIEAALPAVHEAVARIFEADRLIGLAVGVVVDGELVFTEGLGSRDAVAGGTVDARTAFRIGSITKVFAALTALRLVEAGKLDLDAPASSLLPEFAAFVYPTADARPLTVRDILTHTSGLPRDPDMARVTPEGADPRDELMQAIDRMGLARPPGVAYEYSNLAFALLGHLIARIEGRPFAAFVRDAILAPLGMTSTTIDWSELDPERLALGHLVADGEILVRQPTRHGALDAAGGLLSTVEDLARFVAFQLDAWPPRGGSDDGPLRRATTRDAQRVRAFRSFVARTRPAELAEDGVEAGVAGVGLGWHVSHECEHPYVVGHNGATGGYHATVRLLPHAGVGVIVLANASWANTGAVADEIQRVLDAAGGLKPRAPEALPELLLAAQQVTDLLSDWDMKSFAELSSHNLRAGSSPTRLAERMRWLHDNLGDCMLEPPKRVTSPWSAVFPLSCQLGQAELTLTLTTAREPKIASLELRWLHGAATPEVTAAAADVVGLLAQFDPARYYALFSPLFTRTATERLGAIVRFEHGTCKLGKPLAVAGPDEATFALKCDRSDARMTVALDRGTPPRVTLVRVAPAGAAPPCR